MASDPDDLPQRQEHDSLGAMALPAAARHGIHTARALDNFPLLGRPVHPALARAYGAVKLAALRCNRRLGFFPDPAKADAMERACRELMDGTLVPDIRVDALQGGAGTSTNMNVNEVLANRALELLGLAPGAYGRVSPLDDVNLHQSTNDTYPTALRVAAILGLRELERRVLALQEAFQDQEKAMAHVVKVARTEGQDAVLTTLGRSMGAYAEALNRDRWRLAKSEERLRVVNLGGTAIGTGLAAPTPYIFQVVEDLREITGLGLARAENLVEATQNLDTFVEVSGLLKALATTLIKVCSDLRLLSSGPEAGLGELKLPECQAGSSIMPGKVNPPWAPWSSTPSCPWWRTACWRAWTCWPGAATCCAGAAWPAFAPTRRAAGPRWRTARRPPPPSCRSSATSRPPRSPPRPGAPAGA